MYRKVAGIVLGAAAMQGSYVSALGLGEMTMHSALHQPLKADIKLTNADGLDSDQIKIRLADQKAFDMAGVDRTYFLTKMRFAVKQDKSGNPYIEVTTKGNVKEPFLDFLVEVRWPTGKVVRSYTALVDLPVFQSSSTPVVNTYQSPQVQSSSSAYQKQPASVESFSYNQTEAPAAPSAPVTPDGNYRIRNNDTLWEIAKAVRPSGDLSINKTMLALQRLNPEAFPTNNINRIRSGSLLKIPTAADINSITTQQAAVAISAQNKQWRGAQLSATEAAAISAPASNQADGHLSLASSGDSLGAGSAEDGSANGSLAAERDALTAQQLENDQLDGKVKAMGDQIAELERLIELKDAELATLQSQLAAQNGTQPVEAPIETAVEEPVVEPLQTETVTETAVPAEAEVVAETEVPAEVEAPVAEAETVETVAEVAETPAPAPVDEAPVTPEVEPKQEAAFDPIAFLKTFDPIHLGVLGLFIMSLVGAFAIQRRNKREKEALESALAFEYDDENNSEDVQTESETPVIVDENLDHVEETISDSAEEVSEEPATEQVVLETDDALGEADIYVAYGRYNEAIELLNNAKSSNDDTIPLRNKLLSIYLETDNKDAFREEYTAAQSAGFAPVTSYAKDLLSSSEHTDWLDDITDSSDDDDFGFDSDFDVTEDVAETQAEEVAANEEVSFDFDESILDESSEAPSKTEETSVDLDLSFDVDDTASSESTTEETSLDFDFDELSNAETPAVEAEIELDEQPESLTAEEESIDIDLSDFGLDIEDSEQEVAATDTVEGIEIDERLHDLSSLDEMTLDFSEDSDNLLDDEATTSSKGNLDSLDLSDLNLDLGGDAAEAPKVEDSLTATTENEGLASINFDDDPDLSFIASSDEAATKLDLARAYIDMGDLDGAKDMLKEVIEGGEDTHKQEASQLLESCN